MGKLLTQLSKADIMNLTKTTYVPTTEVTHVVVDEEIVGLYIVCPAIFLAVTPAIALTVDDKSTDKELFHRAGVYLAHAVQLTVTLQDSAHRLAKLLLVPVACRASGLLGLTAEHTDNVSDKAAYHVVL